LKKSTILGIALYFTNIVFLHDLCHVIILGVFIKASINKGAESKIAMEKKKIQILRRIRAGSAKC